DAVGARSISAPVTQQGEGHSNLVSEGFVREGAVHAHTQDLGVGGFQLFQVLLEVFHLLGSTTGESKDVEGQHNIFLAAVLAQSYIFQIVSIEVLQFEVGSDIADLEFGRRWSLIVRSLHREGESSSKQTGGHCGVQKFSHQIDSVQKLRV